MEVLLEFFSFAFPKAGALVGSIPLTIALLLLAVYTLSHVKGIIYVILSKKILGWSYIVLCCNVFWVAFLNYGTSLFMTKMAEGILYIISPLMVLVGLKIDKKNAIKCIYFSVFIVAMFAIIQFVFGIEKTKIIGLTIQWGDSYSNKTIGMGQLGMEAVKIPSTYQVGNLMGAFLLQTLPIIIWDTFEVQITNIKRTVKFSCIFLGIISSLLSGSRSVIVAIIIICIPLLVSLLKKLSINQIFLFTFCFVIFLILFNAIDNTLNLGFMDRMYKRYIYQTFFGSGGSAGTAGRTDQWSLFGKRIDALSFFELFRFVFCGLSWNNPCNVEGILYVLSYYGLVAFFNFIILLIRPIKLSSSISKFWKYSFISVIIVLCVDRTFCSTPTLMNYFFMFGLSLQIQNQTKYGRK